jgi:hypothetical protein
MGVEEECHTRSMPMSSRWSGWSPSPLGMEMEMEMEMGMGMGMGLGWKKWHR